MNAEKYVFSQLVQWVPHYEFRRIIERYGGEYKVREFSCWDQFLCMTFAQVTGRESLRDIEACLRSRTQLLYQLGIRGLVSRSTLADANETRDWRIYADLAHFLIRHARKLYADDVLSVPLDEPVYAFDSTTIDLCLHLFPWARFRRHKAAIKLHTLLDLRGAIPTLIYLSDGKLHDVNALDELLLEAGAFYVMDRGYVDFARLYRFAREHAFYVTRAKSNLRYRRLRSLPVEPDCGVRSDQIIKLTGMKSARAYPDTLRRIRYVDPTTHKVLVFLTNHLALPARVVAQLYKCRWQIELFFKWIKQNLRIKTFYGTSNNAVRTQIWIAVGVYVLAAIAKKELQLSQSLSTMMKILSVSPFEKVTLQQLFTETSEQNLECDNCNQLMLFNL